MATTDENSDQLDAIAARDGTMPRPIDWNGRLRLMRFSFTQGAAAGDSTSTIQLVDLPAGRVRILARQTVLECSAFGASRTLDVGYAAHTDLEGTAVAADVDAILDGVDVSSAAVVTNIYGAALDKGDTIDLTSAEGVRIFATVTGSGTIPAGATVDGYFVVVTES